MNSAPVFVAPHPALTWERREDVVPGEPLDSERLRLRREVALEVGERPAHGLEHRFQRGPVDGVREERRVERGVPVPALGQDVGRALDRVERGRERDGPLLPDGDLRLVRAAPHVPIGIRREVAHFAHRQPPLFAVQLELGGELRRDVAVQLPPCDLPRRRERGGEILLRLGHQVLRLDLRPPDRVFVLARLLGAREEVVRVHRSQPGSDARLQVGEADRLLHEPAQARLGDGIPRVDRDFGGEVGVHEMLALEQCIQPLQHAVEVRFEGAVVHQLSQREDLGSDLLQRGLELG